MDGSMEGRHLVEKHFAEFQRLISRAEGSLRAGRYGLATVHAEIAANYAMSKHPGLFASPRLESVLLTIGQQAIRPAYGLQRQDRSGQMPRHILHVLTRAFGIGGDARMVWRWIQQDSGRQHSVALTRQGPVPVPPALRDAASAAGGRTYVLNQQMGSMITWASTLRKIAASVDTVVLHIHPYDVVPFLALADKQYTPPVIYVDHADHAFWIGTSISDVVAGLRVSGATLARTRRGIAPERSYILPTVLPPLRRALSRVQAKRELGLDAGSVVLLSIARPHKYQPLGGLNFLAALLPVLEQHPRAMLLVIGPDQEGAWASASKQTQGRVRALGRREDTARFYQAADIYVDSFPIVSTTSLLEAGSYGMPLVSRYWPAAKGTVLAADTPGLDRCLLQAGDEEAYHAILSRLIVDGEYRTQVGDQAREVISAIHHEPGWRSRVETLYEQVAGLPAVTPPSGVDDRCNAEEVDLWLPQVFRAEPDLERITQFHLQLMPPSARLANWFNLRKANNALSPGLLLPEWLGTWTGKLGLTRPVQ